MRQIDFFARWPHYLDHMLPIALHLGDRLGSFLIPAHLREYAIKKGVPNMQVLTPSMQNETMNVIPTGENPMLVAGVSDLQLAYLVNKKREHILMEHGVGLVFPNNPSYAGNTGFRKKAVLTLAPNQIIHDKTKKAIPDMPQAIIGTPKLDPWAHRMVERENQKPIVAIAFHWNGSAVAPEAGTAFRHYEKCLSALGKETAIQVIGHGHPRSAKEYQRAFEKNQIEWEPDFEQVMERADVYVNDCSSTLYEFLVTGKPVLILNAPWFRKDFQVGIRFWDFTDIGLQIEHPDYLLPAIYQTLQHPFLFEEQRKLAIKVLYPHWGQSAQLAANLLKERYS